MAPVTNHSMKLIKEAEKALRPNGGPVQEQYDKIQTKKTPLNFHLEELPIDGDWMRENHHKHLAYVRGLDIHPHRNFTSGWNRTAKTLKPLLERFDNSWPALVDHLDANARLRDAQERLPAQARPVAARALAAARAAAGLRRPGRAGQFRPQVGGQRRPGRQHAPGQRRPGRA